MNKTIRFSAVLVALAALAIAVVHSFAADEAEYSFREGVRTGVVTSLFSVAVSAPGHLSVATNLTVGGTAVITGTATVGDDLTCDTVIFTDAAVAAPTNTVHGGFTITVNGTNYVIALYLN